MKYFLIIFLLSFHFGKGQNINNLYVNFDVGLSRILTSGYGDLTDVSNYLVPSGNFSLGYNLNIRSNHFIEGELMLSWVRGRQLLKYISAYNLDGSINTIVYNYNNRSMLYIGLPFLYGYKFNNVNVKFGIIVNYFLKGEEHRTYCNISKESYKSLDLDLFDYGPLMRFAFNINKKSYLQTSIYYGINNVLKGKSQDRYNWSIQRITIGYNYIIK